MIACEDMGHPGLEIENQGLDLTFTNKSITIDLSELSHFYQTSTIPLFRLINKPSKIIFFLNFLSIL